MKINELRIGNYYKLKDGVLGGNVCQLKRLKDFMVLSDLIEDDVIEEIPITEEWLINLGFNKQLCKRIYFNGNCFKIEMNNYNTWFYVYKYKRNDAGSKDEGWKAYIETDHHNEIKYNDIYCLFYNVHQLQNIYFTLTGFELELSSNVS